MADATKPDILIFCNGTVDGGLKKMKEKANVHQASYGVPGEPSSLLQRFSTARAIWIVDPDITLPQHHELSRQVVEYVKNGGGIVIMGGFFSSFVQPDDMDHWLGSSWGMPWMIGQYERTTVILQDSHVGLEASTRALLPTSYSSNILFLKNVLPSDSLYASPHGARSELIISGPVPVKAETAVAFGKCGQGWLGYTGDVNNESETAEVVLAMMGLLD
ncbi:putative triacylglycerol lipase [Rosellinia necatrix]|uniref:Putative triacylglycerol lipase n=1 Tax=Rosellinia necatrix TaxID=77044 RepID=A0A1S7UNZ3_ROSNE|nr:putative triacylglycerol lipase [Rosellinia necatrix]